MKAIIFDKDDTLIIPKSGEIFVRSLQDQTPKIDRHWLKSLKTQGFALYIASNQGGVAAGYKTMEEAIAEMKFCLGLFPQIDYGVFCPAFDGTICVEVSRNGSNTHTGQGFRKPDGGMIDLICQQGNINKSASVFVGDRPEDANAAKSAGIEFMDINDFLEGGYREICA